MAIHLILQGKGGVGKSMICAMLAQYYVENGVKPICIDTDPVNATFHGFEQIETQQLKLMKENHINPRALDSLMELAAENPDKTLIIDNGSSSFIPLSAYILENDAIEILRDMGHEVYIHTVITGGQALIDTLAGYASIIHQFDDVKIAVWLNEYFGEIKHEGKQFKDLELFTKNKKKINALFVIPKQSELFADDVKAMLEQRMTFEEVKTSKLFSFMEKNRLQKFKKTLFAQMTHELPIAADNSAEQAA